MKAKNLMNPLFFELLNMVLVTVLPNFIGALKVKKGK